MSKDDFNFKANENANQIHEELISLEKNHFKNGHRDYKSFWDHTKEIQNMFNELKPLLREEREKLWSIFNKIKDTVKEEQDEYYSQSKENAKLIENELYNLKSGHWDMLVRDYKSFWAHTKEIQIMFNELKPIIKIERENLWQKFNEIRDDTRQRQDNEWLKKNQNLSGCIMT